MRKTLDRYVKVIPKVIIGCCQKEIPYEQHLPAGTLLRTTVAAQSRPTVPASPELELPEETMLLARAGQAA